MLDSGASQKEVIRPDFNRAIMIDFQGARVSYHARRWYVHVASAFPLAHHYRAALAWDS